MCYFRTSSCQMLTSGWYWTYSVDLKCILYDLTNLGKHGGYSRLCYIKLKMTGLNPFPIRKSQMKTWCNSLFYLFRFLVSEVGDRRRPTNYCTITILLTQDRTSGSLPFNCAHVHSISADIPGVKWQLCF